MQTALRSLTPSVTGRKFQRSCTPFAVFPWQAPFTVLPHILAEVLGEHFSEVKGRQPDPNSIKSILRVFKCFLLIFNLGH